MNHIYRSIWSEALGAWIAVSELAKGHGKSRSTRSKLLATGLLICSASAWALPTGDQLVAGQATVSMPNANVMQIDQTSQKAVIDWQGFSVQANEAINIQQPNTQAALLNRVVGQDASQIQGQINANGQVYLVNPNGVVFSKTAQVDVGGLITSTHNIKNADFINGNYHFTQDGATGSIVNNGTIQTPAGGVVALIGEKVINTGSITTPEGTTLLAAGKTVDLDFKGDGLVEVTVPEAALNAQISNQGAIQADGGRVVLTARAAGQLMDTVINQEGIIRAQSLVERNGEIILEGGNNGKVQVSGTLDTRSSNLGLNINNENTNQGLNSSGGNITVKGADIQLANGAKLNASGNTGGGTINIGDKQTTHTSTIDEGATVSAQTLNNGTAGTINVFANMNNGTVNVDGQLDASAPKSGNGGFIDTSAARVKVSDSAKVTTKGNQGNTGTWLIDPIDFTITNDAATQTISGIGATTLSNNLNTNSVTITTDGATAGNGDIFVNGVVSWAANTLTLNAHRNININVDMNGSGSAKLALIYDQALGGGDYFINNGAKVALPEGLNFSTTSGQSSTIDYWVITRLGVEGSTTATDLQGINGNLTNNYVLGADIDASITSSWNGGAGFDSLGTSTLFLGNFDGLGHTITGLTINRPTTDNVGLFGVTEFNTIRNLGLLGGSVTGNSNVGGLVGSNNGGVSNTYATDSVIGNSNVGGLVGSNDGFLSNSYATGSVSGNSNVGGLVGVNNGNSDFFADISNSYATGSVTGNANVGGFVGLNDFFSSISNTYATGLVSGSSNVGGLVGVNNNLIASSFWDTQTTGRSLGIGSGIATGTTGKTTADMKQLATFSSAGWDIANTSGSSAVWRIYEGDTAPLLRSWLKPLTVNANISESYNGLVHNSLNNASYSIPNAPSSGHFFYTTNPYGNAINVGAYPLIGRTYSDQQGYDINNLGGTLSITPANLSITANNASKTYGQVLNFLGTEFTTSGLQNGETVGSVVLSSLGANQFANVQRVGITHGGFCCTYYFLPYAIDANNASGGTFNASNYNINYNIGLLDVSPAILTYTANAATRTYGAENPTFSGTVTGFVNTDTLASATTGTVSFTSLANNLSNVGNYAIDGSGLIANNGNYFFTQAASNGALTVNPAALSITANNASKTYGQVLNFLGTEFTSSGLQNGETIGTVNLVSAGVDATAPVAGNPYTITSSNATGGTFSASNYSINYNDGALLIDPAPLLITANDASKVYGQLLNFLGTEFTSSGLQNGETIGTVSLASTGAIASASVAGNPYTITSSNATGGTFSASNYSISYNDGALLIDRAPLVIKANNDSKFYSGFAYTGGNGVSYTGFVNNETTSNLIGSLSYAGSSQGAVNAGLYRITPQGFSSDNYQITYQDGLLTIDRATPQSQVATLQSSITYNPLLLFFPSSDTITDESSSGKDADIAESDNESFTSGFQNNPLFRFVVELEDEKIILPVLKIKNTAGRVKRLRLSADRQFLSLLLEDGSVRIWDFQSGMQRQIAATDKDYVTDVSAVDDKGEGLSIASKKGFANYDVTSLSTNEQEMNPQSDVSHFVLSDDGSLLLLGMGSDKLSLWDNKQNRAQWQLPYERGVIKNLALSANKQYGAVLSTQLGVYEIALKTKAKPITDAVDIIDATTGKIIKSLPNMGEQVVFMRFKGNDILQVGLANGRLLDWSMATGEKKVVADFDETIIDADSDKDIYAYVAKNGAVRVGDGHDHLHLSIENKGNPFKYAQLLEGGKKLLTVLASGDLSLWDIDSGKKTLRLFSTQQGWTVMDAFGRFDGSEEAMENFSWIAKNEDIPLDSFSENYYEPGLLTNILKNKDTLNNDAGKIEEGISLPPKVDLQLAEQQIKGDKVALQLDVYNRGGGINKVSIYHNGKIIGAESQTTQAAQKDDTDHRSLALNITPNAGNNTIKVVASNDMGIENSSTEVNFDGKAKAYTSSKRLLTVGINQYSDPELSLSYSVADANLMGQVIKDNSKTLLSKSLTDEQATKPKILAELRKLSQGAQQDVLVIYLAGHGMALAKEWYFLPYETKLQATPEQIVATGITATELSDIFKDSKIQHILLMVDSCYSGAGVDTFNKLQNGQRYLSRQLSRSLGITVITAAAKDQEAFELKNLGHGLFTYLIAQEIARKDNNEPITAHGIAELITKTLPKFSKEKLGSSQEPAAYTKGNDFTLTDSAEDKQ